MTAIAQRPRFAPFINRPPLAARYRDSNPSDKGDDGLDKDDEAKQMADYIKKQYRLAEGIEEPGDDDKEKAEARFNAVAGRPDSDPAKMAACAALIAAFIPKGRR